MCSYNIVFTKDTTHSCASNNREQGQIVQKETTNKEKSLAAPLSKSSPKDIRQARFAPSFHGCRRSVLHRHRRKLGQCPACGRSFELVGLTRSGKRCRSVAEGERCQGGAASEHCLERRSRCRTRGGQVSPHRAVDGIFGKIGGPWRFWVQVQVAFGRVGQIGRGNKVRTRSVGERRRKQAVDRERSTASHNRRRSCWGRCWRTERG